MQLNISAAMERNPQFVKLLALLCALDCNSPAGQSNSPLNYSRHLCSSKTARLESWKQTLNISEVL
jgi:hypothetical protein